MRDPSDAVKKHNSLYGQAIIRELMEDKITSITPIYFRAFLIGRCKGLVKCVVEHLLFKKNEVLMNKWTSIH